MADKFELTRRKALLGLGSIGLAGAGAGVGTSALFSDEESFGNNSITAGELDLTVHYETSVNQDGVGTGSTTGKGTIDGNPATYEYDINDVKPGDEGSLTFCFAIVDNPAYLWLSGGLTSESDNSTSEPEGDSPWDRQSNGELATYTRAALYYEDQGDSSETKITEGTLGGILRDLSSGSMPLHGDGDPTAGVLNRPTFGPTSDADSLNFDDVCLRLDWWVPTWIGNEIQSDSLTFGLTFTARQARNNDGSGGWTAVQTGDDLQTAVDDASDGDTLLLASGTHKGSVTVDKPLNIRGEGPTNTSYDGQTASTGMFVTSGDTRISDLTATNAGQAIDVNDHTANDRVSNVILSNIVAENNSDRALVLDDTDNALVRDILTKNNDNDGLSLWYTNDSQVENIAAHENGDNGIYINGDNNYLLDAEANNNSDEGIDVNWYDDLGPDEQRVVLDNVEAKNNTEEDIEFHDNGTDDSAADDSKLIRGAKTYGGTDGLRLGNVHRSEVRIDASSFPNGIIQDGGTDTDP